MQFYQKNTFIFQNACTEQQTHFVVCKSILQKSVKVEGREVLVGFKEKKARV